MSLSYRYKEQLVIGEVSNLTLLANVTSSLLISFLTVEERHPRVVLLPYNITISIGQSNTQVPYTSLNAGEAVYQLVSSSQVYCPMGEYLRFSVVHYPFLQWMAVAFGWAYFLCWNISFYPQILHNFLRKSTEGYSCDKVLLNIFGFLTYSAFKISLYSSPYIQHQYFSLHPGGINPVRLNDVVFGCHGLIITLVILLQILIYSKGFRVSYTACVLFFLLLLASLISVILASLSFTTWLNCLYVLSYIKLIASFTKYIPQVWINYKTKSTVGVNIQTIWLDTLGGAFGILQMIILASNFNDWTSIIGNLAKFLLGIVSLAYNLVFIIQHYVLYRPKDGAFMCFGLSIFPKKKDSELQRLLVESN